MNIHSIASMAMCSRFLAAVLVFVVFGLSACTTTIVSRNALPLSSNNLCAEPIGASLRYSTLTMALGERSNTGYGIDLIGQQQKNGAYQFVYRERKPQSGMSYAQMMISPCLQVVLPVHWKSVVVTRQDTGERWSFTPENGIKEPVLKKMVQ